MEARSDTGVFRRDSHVLEYWLANAEGFELARERVERVVVDPVHGSATELVVRSRVLPGRRRVVPAAMVVAVDPFERLLHVERRRRGLSLAVPVVRQAARARRTLTRLVLAAGARLLTWLDAQRPRLRAWVIAAGRHGRALDARRAAALAWLRPRIWTQGHAACVRGWALAVAAAAAGRRLDACAAELARRGARLVRDRARRRSPAAAGAAPDAAVAGEIPDAATPPVG